MRAVITEKSDPDVRRRLGDLRRFYAILDRLESAIGGRRWLSSCDGRMTWPQRGVYFFMENGEERTDSGQGLRIVRVGTHALTAGSRTTLWNRLAQHKGQEKSGGGNHRGSIFRLLVGVALSCRNGGRSVPTWGRGSNASREIREQEEALERDVSKLIRAMPFIWLAVDDEPGPDSDRGFIERNSIALLSNFDGVPLDPASPTWLGHACERGEGRVKRSGLWNQNHVGENHDPAFLDTFENRVNGLCT